ncbi:MAG TPA: YbaB/EbfC family nucleoid-associated protein [Bacteroidetes bacterium]|nr:YbaB/EbfC family nucleoid-associated protein [Bacteroidota bacterium]
MAKPNLGALLGQFQKIQEQLAKAQEELVDIEVEGTSGGGMVTVRANAKQEILGIKIDPEVVDPDDVDMLEDLIVAAVNQALEKAQQAANEHMQKIAGGMLPNLPGGFKFPGM